MFSRTEISQQVELFNRDLVHEKLEKWLHDSFRHQHVLAIHGFEFAREVVESAHGNTSSSSERNILVAFNVSGVPLLDNWPADKPCV